MAREGGGFTNSFLAFPPRHPFLYALLAHWNLDTKQLGMLCIFPFGQMRDI